MKQQYLEYYKKYLIQIILYKKIEVINAGMNGGNSNTELNLIIEKLLWHKPDLIIIYDGLNDLKGDFPVAQIKHNWKRMCILGRNT